jgi:hypothetical protein
VVLGNAAFLVAAWSRGSEVAVRAGIRVEPSQLGLTR